MQKNNGSIDQPVVLFFNGTDTNIQVDQCLTEERTCMHAVSIYDGLLLPRVINLCNNRPEIQTRIFYFPAGM